MMTLESYEPWKHCITQLCGLPLTGPHIEKRLTALGDPTNGPTQKLVAMRGEQYRLRVIGWFAQAQQEKAGTKTGSAPLGRAS